MKIIKIIAILGLLAVALWLGFLAFNNYIYNQKQGDTNPIESELPQTDTLETDIKNAIVAKHGPGAQSLDITVSKLSGDYAQGGASEEGLGGGMWFAAKVGGNWQLVWDGNGIITCADIADYPDFPATMIPECYDTTTEQLKKR